MKDLSVDELVQLAAAGGGFTVSAAELAVSSLVHIAAAASGTKARIRIVDSECLTFSDMVNIAAAGKGAVSFE